MNRSSRSGGNHAHAERKLLTGWGSFHQRNNSFREHNTLFSEHMRPSSYNTTRPTRNTADPYFTMIELSPINKTTSGLLQRFLPGLPGRLKQTNYATDNQHKRYRKTLKVTQERNRRALRASLCFKFKWLTQFGKFVTEYMSFAKGCSSQAYTWQVKIY